MQRVHVNYGGTHSIDTIVRDVSVYEILIQYAV